MIERRDMLKPDAKVDGARCRLPALWPLSVMLVLKSKADGATCDDDKCLNEREILRWKRPMQKPRYANADNAANGATG